MTQRLNDTAAIVAASPYETQHDHYMRSVRKIDNGFVTTHSQSGPNSPDGPIHMEVFTRDHPDQKDSSEMGGNCGAMRRAVEYMNSK